MIKDLNVRAKIIKYFKEYLSVNLHDLGLSNDFLATTLQQKQRKKKINWTSKFKTSVLQRKLSKKWKDNQQNGRKYLHIMYLIRVKCPEYKKELLQHKNKRQPK